MTPTEAYALVDEHVQQLIQHFDSVTIFATSHSEPRQISYDIVRGAGNWYTQYGVVKDWITKQQHRSRRQVDREEAASDAEPPEDLANTGS